MNTRWLDLALVATTLGTFACGGSDADTAGDDPGTPGTNGANTGISCAESDLIAQCPPGSSPDLSAQATSACEGQVDIPLVGEGGSVHAACKGQSECLVVCNFDIPCTCGLDRITREGVFCVDCAGAAACGNAKCEGGEDPATCPVDCAMVCSAGQQRCNGRNREDCNGQGSWETVECRDDQACELQGGVACQPFLSPSGGTWPGTGWETLHLPADPADIYFAETEFACPGNSGACTPVGWVDDTTLLGTIGAGLALLPTDGRSAEMLSVSIPQAGLGLGLPWVVTSDRQPVLFNLDTRQSRTAEPVVDDVTPLLTGGVAVDATRGRAAVAFAANGQPFVALYTLADARIEAMLRYAAPGLTSAAAALAFSPDGQLLAELRPEGRTIVWNVAERKHTRLIDLEIDPQGFSNPGVAVAFTAGVGPLLLATTSAWVEIWDLEENKRVRRSEGRALEGFGGRFSLSPDGRIAASLAAGVGGVGLYLVPSLNFVRTLGADLQAGAGMGVFSADGRRLAVGKYVFTSAPFAD